MAQNITLNVIGKSFKFKADSEDSERILRLAAESVNRKIEDLNARFPNVELVDKLCDVLVRETSSRILYQSRIASIEKEAGSLSDEMKIYLGNNKK